MHGSISPVLKHCFVIFSASICHQILLAHSSAAALALKLCQQVQRPGSCRYIHFCLAVRPPK